MKHNFLGKEIDKPLTAPYLESLFFFKYLAAQLPHGLFPSHLVFRARQRSQLAHKATIGDELESALIGEENDP